MTVSNRIFASIKVEYQGQHLFTYASLIYRELKKLDYSGRQFWYSAIRHASSLIKELKKMNQKKESYPVTISPKSHLVYDFEVAGFSHVKVEIKYESSTVRLHNIESDLSEFFKKEIHYKVKQMLESQGFVSVNVKATNETVYAMQSIRPKNTKLKTFEAKIQGGGSLETISHECWETGFVYHQLYSNLPHTVFNALKPFLSYHREQIEEEGNWRGWYFMDDNKDKIEDILSKFNYTLNK